MRFEGADLTPFPEGLSGETLVYMHNHPFRTCTACGGNGVGGLMLIEDPQLGFGAMVPFPCGSCLGSGVAPYLCFN